ncbi:nucleobindin 1 isoform X2 [Megachile rotundata]|uniref:nucleobindin 1 isoform X2 n=1 Tax=Megachile rotundata TaxID=143995 RepID=UPI003FD3AD44
MKYFLFLLISVIVQLSVAPPVNQKSKDGEHKNGNDGLDMYYLDDEYRRYLMEVVQVLESDPEFRAKLEKADEADIRTGKIAEELQFVNHNIRSRLDELKREELVRLRHLATKENELKNDLDIDHLKIAEHLDHTNTRTFEIQDLKKLIAKTTEILSNADNARREQFKYHEMEKEYEEQGKLKHMSEEERKKYEQELKALKEQQKKHEPVHHPGSKQQLEEVWEKQDHMEPEEFNPRTFFFFHDLDGNGVWDQDEAKALFLKELDKLYVQGTSHVDLLKRAEEMERMREHVFNEIDLNKDGLISYEEFLEQTKKPDFQQDEGWQALDEQEIYTRDEFEHFQRQKELAAQAMPLPQYGHVPEGGVHPADLKASSQQNLPQQQFQDHSQHHQQQGNVVPQHQYPNHMPIQPIHDQSAQQHQQNQHFQEQVPMNQQYQQMQGQVPVQQMQGQVPVQQMQGQVPVQQMQGQVPVQQMHGQVPIQPIQASVQQEHIPVQQHQPQASNFQQQQNIMNQVPQNVQNNVVPQHNNPSQANVQSAQAQVQQEINRNVIPSAGKM